MKTSHRLLLASLLATVAVALSGCQSKFVQAVVRNDSAQPISLVEVDYPSASFGRQTIAAGAQFEYRFKVLGSGPVKISYRDGAGHDQNATGPELREGLAETLQIVVTDNAVQWKQTSTGAAPAR